MAQVLGVGSIIPLMDVLSNPDDIGDQAFVNFVTDRIELRDSTAVVMFLSVLAFVALVGSNALISLNTWFSYRFVWSVQTRLSTDILHSYLRHPYEQTLNRNPAHVEKNVLEEAVVFTNGVLRPILRFISSMLVVSMLVVFLVWYEPKIAAISIAVIGSGYVISFLLLKNSLARAGSRRTESNEQRFKAAAEALGGLKEIQILGYQQEFVSRYSRPTGIYAKATAHQNLVTELPRYIIEVLAFGTLLIAAYVVASTRNDLNEVAPTLSVFAIAAYRIVPAMQRAFSDWGSIRFNSPVVEPLYAAKVTALSADLDRPNTASNLTFEKSISICDGSYAYPGSQETVLQDINLEISRGETVAFIGRTGSGKTTLAEMLIGLLTPSSGQVRIDDALLDQSTLRSWQDIVGYVPQDIYLIDDTVSANIAFGINQDEIYQEAVEMAAKNANIHEFIKNSLPYGYSTMVGDRGVRLSGGQRQRIGIARALYQSPKVLLLDEATSNLDHKTEQVLHQTLEDISRDLTVVMIAHRLNTTRIADRIYQLENGRIARQGSYEEIVESGDVGDSLVRGN